MFWKNDDNKYELIDDLINKLDYLYDDLEGEKDDMVTKKENAEADGKTIEVNKSPEMEIIEHKIQFRLKILEKITF